MGTTEGCWVPSVVRPWLRVPVPAQVSGEKKAVGSTAGMQSSVDTSPLLKVGDGGARRKVLGFRVPRGAAWR